MDGNLNPISNPTVTESAWAMRASQLLTNRVSEIEAFLGLPREAFGRCVGISMGTNLKYRGNGSYGNSIISNLIINKYFNRHVI